MSTIPADIKRAEQQRDRFYRDPVKPPPSTQPDCCTGCGSKTFEPHHSFCRHFAPAPVAAAKKLHFILVDFGWNLPRYLVRRSYIHGAGRWGISFVEAEATRMTEDEANKEFARIDETYTFGAAKVTIVGVAA